MTFGKYFRELRISKKKTQQEIADSIGKTKMLISGVETGKNGPFLDEDLIKIATCLQLTDYEYKELAICAANEKGKIPVYMMDYIANHNRIYELLELMASKALDEEALEQVITFVGEIR